MKILRIALMGIGVIQVLSFIANVVRNLPKNPQYLQTKDFVETSVIKLQSSFGKGLEISQKAMDNSLETLQAAGGSLSNQLSSNGLYILFIAILAIFVLRRLLKQNSRAGSSE